VDGLEVETSVSEPSHADVEALVERLREELAAPGSGAAAGSRGRFLAARAQAERVWPVSAERLVVRRPGLKGTVLHPVKKVLARLMRWYVEPFAAEQREYNDALLKAADALSDGTSDAVDRFAGLVDVQADRVSALMAKVDELQGAAERATAEAERAERRVTELEERLTRAERRIRGAPQQAAATPVAAGPPPSVAAAVPDYFAFESRMRGSTDEIRERQRVYLDDFRDAAPVLDIGCGRGEFLGLLREAGLEARGLDVDADMVAYARGEGLDVALGDAAGHLASLPGRSLGGIFMAQVVEHLPAPELVRVLELAAAKLRPGGVLVAETINPLSPLALRSYFADLTHAQPLVPETLELLARQAGFAEVDVRYLNPPPAPEGLEPRVAELLFAPLDYAIVARTGA
jgi:O-antigen chain-terminating methyltransferase